MDEKIELFKKDLRNLCESHGIEHEDIGDIIRSDETRKEEKKLRDEVAGHRYLVGKAYRKKIKPVPGRVPEMYRYYKVVSERSDNSGSVTCLIFDEIPEYGFVYRAHKLSEVGDYFLGFFEFCPIWVESIRVQNGLRGRGLEDMEGGCSGGASGCQT